MSGFHKKQMKNIFIVFLPLDRIPQYCPCTSLHGISTSVSHGFWETGQHEGFGAISPKMEL